MRRTVEQEEQFNILQFKYTRVEYSQFNYNLLDCINHKRHKKESACPLIIAFDTETSKEKKNTTFFTKKKGKIIEKINPVNNYVVAWTVSIGTIDKDLFTIYGHKPSELIECMTQIREHTDGHELYFYAHNLSYDYTFLRKFMFKKWGHPIKQLNTKPHYPIMMEFENGIILKDSLILAQRKLEKWAEDLGADTQKAIGSWKYDDIRHQDSIFSEDELLYIENDTKALIECLRIMCKGLNKEIYTLPYTATGIVREKVKNVGLMCDAKQIFNKCESGFEVYKILEMVFHGGYTHANKLYAGRTILNEVHCYDFASSYPYVLLVEKYPMTKYLYCDISDINTIINTSDNFSYVFKAAFIGIDAKMDTTMPFLSYSKSIHTINPICDNGRIEQADLVEIWLNEIDLEIIREQYTYVDCIIENCYYAEKQYLPKWFTDIIYNLFVEKTKLKGVDNIRYQIAKGMLNSCYGMCAQHYLRDDIQENFDTGEYIINNQKIEEEYTKYINKKTSILPYQWGIYVTCYATRNLFRLGKMFDIWIYSDTDSVYGINPNIEQIEKYNNECKVKLLDRGYDKVIIDGKSKEYWLGVAEHEGEKDEYIEFRTLGAKRYVGRCKEDNKLHLTVSGVPKKGVEQLNDNIRNFKTGFIFKGEQSGKLTHFYQYSNDIYMDKNGNECADSIDLCPCDYELSNPYDWTLEDLLEDEEGIFCYDEEYYEQI